MNLAQGGLILVRSTAVAIDGATDIRQTIVLCLSSPPAPPRWWQPPESPTGSSSLVAAKPRLSADTSREIDAAFATFARDRPDALFVGNDVLFASRRVQFATLAVRHLVPTIYPQRDFVEAGGLMSYGASLLDALRQVGAYTGRILKGAKAADLPVAQSTKFELVINHQTARILGLTVPDKLLAAADEVIE